MNVMVMGIGNPDRGDDGVGAAVVAALTSRVPEGVVLRTRRSDMLALVEEWRGVDTLVCVDATQERDTPGRLYRFDLSVEALPTDLGLMSSHAFGLCEAIALARNLDLAPRQIIVHAVEGQNFGTGAGLSPQIAAAVPVAARRVIEDIAAYRSLKEKALSHG